MGSAERELIMRSLLLLVIIIPVLGVRRFSPFLGFGEIFRKPFPWKIQPFIDLYGSKCPGSARRIEAKEPVPLPAEAEGNKLKLGELVALKPDQHPMEGTVYYNKDDESMIIVSKFFYPSPGPDAFFWAGEDSPGCDENSIRNSSYNLAPGVLGSSDYLSPQQPILPAYDGLQGDLVLRLPAGKTVRDLQWICVWCREYLQNFGKVKINL